MELKTSQFGTLFFRSFSSRSYATWPVVRITVTVTPGNSAVKDLPTSSAVSPSIWAMYQVRLPSLRAASISGAKSARTGRENRDTAEIAPSAIAWRRVTSLNIALPCV